MSLIINPYRFVAAGGSPDAAVSTIASGSGSGQASSFTTPRGSGNMLYIVGHQGNRDVLIPSGPTRICTYDGSDTFDSAINGGASQCEVTVCYWEGVTGSGDLTWELYTSANPPTYTTLNSGGYAFLCLEVTTGTYGTNKAEEISWAHATTSHTIPADELASFVAGDLLLGIVGFMDSATSTDPDTPTGIDGTGWSLIETVRNTGSGTRRPGITVWKKTATATSEAAEGFTSDATTQVLSGCWVIEK